VLQKTLKVTKFFVTFDDDLWPVELFSYFRVRKLHIDRKLLVIFLHVVMLVL